MYVGAWQEYRLGQLFGEQNRLMGAAVREAIRQQIIEEHTRQPQVQINERQKGKKRNGQTSTPLSHSERLKRGLFGQDAESAAVAAAAAQVYASKHRSTSTLSTHRSSMDDVSSTISSHRSLLETPTPSSHASHSNASLRGSYSASSTSQLPTPFSLHSVTTTPTRRTSVASSSSSIRSLPPIQAAAQAAVHAFAASRLRSAHSHPLAHVMQTYMADAHSSPRGHERSASHLSHSSTSTVASTSSITPGMPLSYFGAAGAAFYRPPPPPKRRRSKRGDSNGAGKNGISAAAAHREHMQRMRTLYGLEKAEGAAPSNGPVETVEEDGSRPVRTSAPLSDANNAGVNHQPPSTLSSSSVALPHIPSPRPASNTDSSELIAFPSGRGHSAMMHSLPPQHPASAASSDLRLPSVNGSSGMSVKNPSSARHSLHSPPHSSSNSRLSTPLHQHIANGRVSRSQLHSSGGVSDSAEFEDEVNDLLGWTRSLTTQHMQMEEETLPMRHSTEYNNAQVDTQVLQVYT